jgi:hypothetical protein
MKLCAMSVVGSPAAFFGVASEKTQRRREARQRKKKLENQLQSPLLGEIEAAVVSTKFPFRSLVESGVREFVISASSGWFIRGEVFSSASEPPNVRLTAAAFETDEPTLLPFPPGGGGWILALSANVALCSLSSFVGKVRAFPDDTEASAAFVLQLKCWIAHTAENAKRTVMLLPPPPPLSSAPTPGERKRPSSDELEEGEIPHQSDSDEEGEIFPSSGNEYESEEEGDSPTRSVSETVASLFD